MVLNVSISSSNWNQAISDSHPWSPEVPDEDVRLYHKHHWITDVSKIIYQGSDKYKRYHMECADDDFIFVLNQSWDIIFYSCIQLRFIMYLGMTDNIPILMQRRVVVHVMKEPGGDFGTG